MACFDNFILIRGACGSATPSSGLYINDLPGVTLRKGANVADEEKNTGIQLLTDSISLGIELTKKDILEKAADLVRFNSVYSTRTQADLDYDNYLPIGSGIKTITSELDSNCSLLRQFIPRIDVLLNTTISGKTISIIDGGTTTNYTLPDVTAGNVVSVFPHYEAVNETIQIQIDTSDVSVSDSSLYGSGFCSNCSQKECSCDCILNISGDGQGLRPTLQIRCSSEAMFCQIATLMGRPAWYHAGMIFIDELLMTQRINVFTLYDIDRAQEIKAEWKETYDQCIMDLVDRLPKFLKQVDSCCVECDSDRWTTAMP